MSITIVQYRGLTTDGVVADTGLRAMLPSSPTAGNIAIVAISAATLPSSIWDNQGNVYSLIKSYTSSSPNIGVYAALIQQSGGYLEPIVDFGTAAPIAVFAAEVTVGNPAVASIQASSATASGTGTVASVGPIAFIGSGLDIGVFGWGSAVGTVSAGAGYSLLYSADYNASTNYGMAVVAKAGDPSGSATPAVTLGASTSWHAVGAVITQPSSIAIATTPNGLPALALGSTVSLAVTGLNTAWTSGMAAWTATGATINSRIVNSPTSVTLSVTASSTRSAITITDTSTGATLVSPGPTGSQAQQLRSAGYWYVASSAHGGSDSNGGTQAAPFLTASHAQSVASANAYDVILLYGGDTFPLSAVITSTVYLFWTSYGTGQGTIAGPNAKQAIVATNAGMFLYNIAVNSSLSAPSVGRQGVIEMDVTDGTTHTAGLTVIGCTITGGQDGLLLNVTSGNGYNHWISNCTITGQFDIGVMLQGASATATVSNALTQDCMISNVSGWNNTNTATGVGIQYNYHTTAAGPSRIVGCSVTNVAYSTGGSASNGGGGGMFPYQSIGVYMSGNAVTEASWGTIHVDGIAFDIDIANRLCTIEGCFGANCDGAGVLFLPNQPGHCIRWNILMNCARQGEAGIHLGGLSATAAAIAHNNTSISLGGNPALQVASNDSGAKKILNNWLVALPGVPSLSFARTLAAGDMIDGNAHQSGAGSFNASLNSTAYTGLSTWVSALSGHTGSPSGEVGPTASQFVDGDPSSQPSAANLAALAKMFAPVVGSPAADAAVNMLSRYGFAPGPIDITGSPVGPTPSIGAVASPGSYATTYDAAVMTAGPYSRFRLGETWDTEFFDSMFNQPYGSYSGVSPGQPGIIPASSRLAAGFNGTSSRAQINAPSGLGASALSVSLWCMPISLASTAFLASAYSPYLGWAMRIINGNLSFYVQDTSNTLTGITSGLALTTGSLQHLALVWPGGHAMQIYLNGVAQHITLSGNAPTSTIQINGLTVGGNYNGSTYGFGGSIEDIAVFNQALTAAQILGLYATGLAIGYTLSGPSSVGAGPGAIFTLTPAAVSPSDTITLSDGGAGGVFIPASLIFADSSSPQTFTYTQDVAGNYSISAISADGGVVNGSPASLAVTPLVVTIPSIQGVFKSVGYQFVDPSGNPVAINPTNLTMTVSQNGISIPGSIAYDPILSVATFTPTSGVFSPGTVYLLSIGGAVTLGGVAISPLSQSWDPGASMNRLKWFGGLGRAIARPMT